MQKQRSFSVRIFLTVAVFMQFGVTLALARANHSVGAPNHNGIPVMGEQTLDKGPLTDLIDAYLKLKDALVNDERKQATKAAKYMWSVFKNVDRSLLKKEDAALFDKILDDAEEQLEHIQKSHIEHQREHFSNLSEYMVDLITAVGTDRKLFVDYCKKCVEGEEALWLSDVKEIINPYNDEDNHTVGEIRDVINP